MRPPHLFAPHSVLHLRLALILGVCRTRRVTGARTRISSCVVRALAPARVHARAHMQAHAQHTRARARAHARVVVEGGGRGGQRHTGASEHHVAHGPASSTPRLHGLRAGRVMPSGVGPCKRNGRRSAALVGPLEGWRVASKRLGPLPRRRGSTLWPMAVAGVATWCCRWRGRPPCQPA